MPESTLLKKKEDYSLEILDYPGLICATSKRLSKNMSLLYADTRKLLSNRKIFLTSLGIDYQHLVCAKQIHSCNVRYAKDEDKGKGALTYASALADTDALITDKRNIPLAVFTADCLSIFLYDPKTAAIGLAHAGWRSSRKKIIAKTIKLMQEEFNTQIENIHLGFGPAIRQCCYEVGADFKDFSPAEFLIKRNGHFYLDLIGLNKKQALDLGVLEGNISDCGICTSCRNREFFSFRKEGNACGRMISVIMLK
jgi:YfiH family protein